MNTSRLDSRLGVMAPMATSKNRASEVLYVLHQQVQINKDK